MGNSYCKHTTTRIAHITCVYGVRLSHHPHIVRIIAHTDGVDWLPCNQSSEPHTHLYKFLLHDQVMTTYTSSLSEHVISFTDKFFTELHVHACMDMFTIKINFILFLQVTILHYNFKLLRSAALAVDVSF